MNILEEISGPETAPVDLAEITAVEIPPLAVPSSTTKNRAAVATMLSGDTSNIAEAYQGAVAGGESGDNSQFDNVAQKYHLDTGALDQKALVSILSDPSLSIDQKKQAVQAHKEGRIQSDSRVHLMTKGLEEASQDETIENEDARISTASMLNEMQAASEQRQALINAHGAGLSDQMGTVAVDAVEALFAPFGQAITSFKYAKALAEKEGRKFGLFDGIKAFALAGDVKADIREKLSVLPPEAQVAYTKNLLDIISKNSSIIVPTDNQFNQMMQAQDILGEGGYSSTAQFLDNASFLLDIIGIGAVAKSGKVAAKGAVAAEDIARHAMASEAKLNHGVGPGTALPERAKPPSSGFEGAKVSAPMEGANDAVIASKQAEIADLLGEAGNLAERGVPSNLRKEGEALAVPDVDVKALTKQYQTEKRLSFKEASKLAQKEADDMAAEYAAKSDRMNNMLDINANASNASQRIDALEKEIAALQKSNVPVPAKKNPIAELISRIEQNSVVRRENPASVANVLQQTNPAKARAAHAAMFADETGMAADAMYGTDRVQAIANDILPQIPSGSGAVTAKIADIDRDVRRASPLSNAMRELAKSSDVGIHLSKAEAAAARANVVNKFSDATDLVPIDSMGGFTTKLDGSYLEISSVYGTRNGAFTNAQEAVNQALHALRKEGVLADELTVMKKQGLDYVPTTLADEVGKEGNYLIKLKMDRELTAADIGEGGMDSMTVKRNFADRLSNTISQDTGSMSRWMFDAASMLDPRITGAAVAATDITSRFERYLLNLATEFTEKFNALPKERQVEVSKYIREANFNSIKFDYTDVTMNRGFSNTEADALKTWRDYWDTHYYLENFDMVRTYNAQGYMQMENMVGDVIHAKPMHKNNGIPNTVYDSTQGVVVKLSRQEFDDLYDSGGTIAKLRRPTTFGADTTEHVIVRNDASEYLRRFRDSDQILNYKDGYYQIQYKAPRFVDEVTYKPGGEIENRRAIAVGASTKEVSDFAARMSRADPTKSYVIRSNDRGMARGSDDWFDVNAASGRIAQKQRGKLLEDADGINFLGDGSYVLDPVESAVRAAKSIAGRTVMRPMLESAKERYLRQYASVLPSDGMGGNKFPGTPGEIGAKGMTDSKMVADARTTWEYLHYLENGYINSLDVFLKQGLNATATWLGEKRFDKLEKAALWAADTEHGITGTGKGAVFGAYIALNPLRQWIIQPHQIVRTFGYNPVGWMLAGPQKLMGEYVGQISGALKNPSANGLAFRKFLDESGLLDSVDKQNLVRGSLSDAVEGAHGPFKWGKKAIEMTRRVGFDVGEMANLVGHGAAVFDLRVRKGLPVTGTNAMREMHSELRALSYDMNFAGDMVYNQTSAAMVLQFLQVPHKAFLQATNRRIAPAVRAKMLATDLVMFGAPVALISSVFGGDVLTGDKKIDELYMNGIEATLINNLWTHVTGEEQEVDYSGLSPYGLDGWAKMYHTLMTDGGVIPALMNSPAGQVFFKDSGRIQSAMYALGRYFTPFRDEERTKEETLATVNEVMKIASGWNNGLKAKLMFSTGQAMDRNGVLIDPSVSNHEAFMQIFGFSTSTVKQMYETQTIASQGSKQHADDVKQVFNSIKAYYQSQFEAGVTDIKQMQAVTGEILSMYKDDPIALQIISKSFQQDVMGKEPQLFVQLLKSVELPTSHITKDQIRNAPITDEQKDVLIKRIDDAANARLEINKE